MILQSVWQMSLGFLGDKPIVVEPVEEDLTSDAGLLPIRQFDEQIGLTHEFAAALADPRRPELCDHTFAEMTRMRIYGVLAGYEDQNDHDLLRGDPAFKLAAGRPLDEEDLASQPTLSRFENAIDIPSLLRLQELLLEQFIASFEEPPRRLTLDIDAFDDPTHGQQQLTFFHGYYGQYQYLPRTITCAENDQVLQLSLLFGKAHAALGADEDLEYVITRLREAFPEVEIHVRGDSGFGVPKMYDLCERLEVFYTFGLGVNARLKQGSEELLQRAVEQYEESGDAQRLFGAGWYRAGSWPAQRWVIVKCEANWQGTNRRAVVTNRPGAKVLPEAAYDAYAERGESENRHKELKGGLKADRLSDHRYLANLFRLYMHAAAYNLLARVRRLIADPPPEEGASEDVPAEALAGAEKRRLHNRRRRRDPLGEGQPCTWRTRLIKVAARLTESSRRVRVQLSGSWSYLHHYRWVTEQVLHGCGPPEPA